MAYEHEDGTASLFQNDYKEDGDKRPDYTGKGRVGGDMKEFALWKRETKKGTTMLFVKWTEPREKFQPKKGEQAGF